MNAIWGRMEQDIAEQLGRVPVPKKPEPELPAFPVDQENEE